MTRDEKIDMCIDIVEHLVEWCKGNKHCRDCPFIQFNSLCLIHYVNEMDEEAADGEV